MLLDVSPGGDTHRQAKLTDRVTNIRAAVPNDPLKDFAEKYKASKTDPLKRLSMRFDLLEQRLDQLEAEIWQRLDQKTELDEMHSTAIQRLRDELILTKSSVLEHIEEDHGGEDATNETKNLIREYQRKLKHLQKQEARYGTADLPVHIALDIEQTETRIAQLQEELMR